MNRAFAYLRVSGQGQAAGDGFDRQRLAIEAHASANQITIAGWYQDIQTGKDEWQDRPGWSEMMAKMNGVRTVIVEKLDRVARRILVQELIIADLRKRDISLLTSAGDDTSHDDPEREMMRQILGVFAQYERHTIVLKLRGARDRKKAATGRCEGRIPFGGADKNGKVRPGEPEALAFMRQYREVGHTFENVAVALNQSMHKTRSGRTWIGSTICKILRAQPSQPKPL